MDHHDAMRDLQVDSRQVKGVEHRWAKGEEGNQVSHRKEHPGEDQHYWEEVKEWEGHREKER